MSIDRVKFQDTVASQLPSFIREDFPLLSEFLEQYYVSQETQGATLDLLQNIDKYVNIDNLTNLVSSAELRNDIDSVAQDIVVEGNTEGFLDRNGLIKIGDEIILYETKNNTTFQNCHRGFSGTSSYTSNVPDRLTFESSTLPDDHSSGDAIQNLNVLFLQEFFKKLKSQISPGFGNRNLKTNQKNFIINSDSFYKTKGTDLSYKILFKALFGKSVDIIRPSQFLFRPSDASYSVTQDIVVEKEVGDPLDLQSLTLFQDSTGSRGTITRAAQVDYGNGEYYQLSIDFGYDRDINTNGSIYGKFESNPKTKILTQVASGSTIIDVDSTLSFPETGKLEIIDIDGNEVEINYGGKNLNQFLNVDPVPNTLVEKTDIRLDDYAYAYVGINTNEEIRVKITSTLKELKVESNNYNYEKNDIVNIQSMGIEDESINSSEWLNNTKSYYNILSVEITDVLENKYSINTYDDHHMSPGYKIVLSDNFNNTVNGVVTRVTSEKSFIIKASIKMEVGNTWKFENQILKTLSPNYNFLEKYIANVQDTYSNFDGEIIVASNSIPVYENTPLDPYNKTLEFSGSASSAGTDIIDFGTNHGFYTGDAIFYSAGRITTDTTNEFDSSSYTTISKFEGLDEAVYYVRKYNDTSIKLSRSRANLFQDKYVTFSGTVVNNKFTYYNFYQKPLEPQGIFREFTKTVDEGAGNFITAPGYNGMFINGVEILNYKSDDSVFYGPIKGLTVTGGGFGYDVINPPEFVISDLVGTGATGTVAVEGNLERIDIIDSGFDFKTTPIVSISGGNPDKDAQAVANLIEDVYEVNINTEFNGNINLTTDEIGFSTFHKFRQDEEIIYNSRGMKGVSGLSTNSSYFVNVVDNSTITLHNNTTDSQVGINTVDLVNYGLGIQSIKTVEKKNVVSSIVVTNPGSGYKNKKRKIVSSGISTASNSFEIKNHGYKTGEIIRYTAGSSSISGIVELKDYYVRKIDNDTFSLSEVGVGNTNLKYFFSRDIVVDIESVGEGTFNYKPIIVTVDGITGIDSRSGQSFQCQVQPVFRGSIDSIDLTNEGNGYGTSDILNFNRQPDFSFEGGNLAQVQPVINNGRLVDVVITNTGGGYISPPNLIINGPGKFTKLTPIINDGKLTEVKIINSGLNHIDSQTTITVQNPGTNAVVEFDVNEWNINLFSRNFEKISEDDGFVEENISGDSTQYCHIYAPRSLRENTYVLLNSGEKFYGIQDLERINGLEESNTSHSPILGWAYDGCPIYGPYGYTNPDGGIIKQIRSGYELSVDTTNRPSLSVFPEGFFIEDYKFTNVGDLDVHNGRFCVTPDYPEGVYAYFSTLNTIVDGSGPFKNYKRPSFPYTIGNSFYAKRNEFNYKSTSNQVDYDIQSDKWLRNTSTYSTNNTFSGYDYIFDSNKIKKQTINITGSSLGSLNEIGIFTGGRNYQVNDRLVFESEQDGIETSAQAKVSRVEGKEIDTITVDSTDVTNIEFTKISNQNEFIGFATQPHNLKNRDRVNVNNLSSYYKNFDSNYQIGVRTETFVVTLGIGSTSTTGFTTYFYASGLLDYPFIRPNDILGIGTEKVKVLNIDSETERIRVLRAVEGTVGIAHTNRSILLENPRKFTINVGSITTEKYFRINDEFYFDPSESVGVGTTSGNGVGTVVTFRNPGVGASSIFIPTQAIYYKNHGLKFNERVDYFTNSGSSLQVWNGFTSNGYVNLTEYDTLYATPIDKNLIGISSHKVGLSTITGEYVGVGTTSGLLYFNSVGTGDYHSLKTSRSDVLRGSVTTNVVTVSTASTHGLLVDDNVRITVKPNTEQVIDVRYNDYNRRIVFNPIGFTSENVNIQSNLITISNHNFVVGDKVIHTSDDSTGGLVDNKMYYVVPFDKNKIKLVSEKFEINREEPSFIDLTSGGDGGTISKINPLVVSRKNNNLKFDLSDSSLSFLSNGVSYPAFKMSVYLDEKFNKEFLTTGKKEDKSFEVTSSGSVGITSTANLTIEVTNDVPDRLYYKFTPVNEDFNFESKTGIVIDEGSFSPSNQINIELSKLDGEYRVTGTSSTTFSYQLLKEPEATTYTKSNSVSSYITDSNAAYGGIAKVDLTYPGVNYSRIPKISNVISGIGTDSILETKSNKIGKILRSRFDSDNIGFDYPTDETLRPVANLPEVLEMKSLNSFESIGISSFGRNYLIPAKLVVIDGYTNKILPEVDLRYRLGDTQVTILNNTTGMYDIKPTIIPTRNTNGVGISTMSYDNSTKTVRLYLDQTFSTSREFPFVVGEKILVENVNIGTGSIGVGYNSVDHDYTLFPVTAILPQIGGSGAYIEYSLSSVLEVGETPGTVQIGNAGRAIPETHFPIFDISMKTNDFLIGETVTSGVFDELTGVVEYWRGDFEQIKIKTPKEFPVGSVIKGGSSKTQAVVVNKFDFNAEITTGVGATVIRGWQDNVGFLNDNLQVIPNNEYYQKFSYSLSSGVPYQEWEGPVSDLNHTSGFAKFADYQLVSEETDEGDAIVRPSDSNIEIIVDIIGEGDLNCVYDFDFVSEGTQFVNGKMVSNEIFFENQILTDYFQSIGNRVLSIDDISVYFNSNERAEPFEDVASYDLNFVFNKVFTFVKDDVYTDERQFSIVNILQDSITGYVNEYATVETYPRLGFYDYLISGDKWDLTFNPVKFEFNSYDVSSVSISLLDSITGIGSTQIGDIVDFTSSQVTIPGSETTIASFPTTNRAAKVLTMVEAQAGINSGEYHAVEMNVIHDGTNVYNVEYGDVHTSPLTNFSGSLGTYRSFIDSGLVKINFIPDNSVTHEAQTSLTVFSGIGTTAGNFEMNVSTLKSTYTSIGSSGSPSAVAISTYIDPFSASYNVVVVTDTTNNDYEMFECVICNSSTNQNITDYANVITGSSTLGSVGVTSVGSNINLTYTPIASANVEVRTFGIDFKTFDGNSNTNQINHSNVFVSSNKGTYRGTKLDLLTKFGLKHDGLDMFERDFDGSDSDVVNITNGTISIPNHFFVTGEKILYTHAGTGTTMTVGIASTTVSGIGLTDKLPNELYVVKIDDARLKFTDTSEKANRLVPETFSINSLGIGNSHVFTAINQNAKALVAVDNRIQAPVTGTAVTTNLDQNIVFDTVFDVTGITSFASQDIIKIGDEYIILTDVGIAGSTRFGCRRAQLGSTLEEHTNGSLITKISGNYNIVGNTINFASAPHGNRPLSTTAAADPDSRDWTGITTSSSFQGRTFMRRSAINSPNETYLNNIVFDDVSHDFNGINTSFTLKYDDNNTVGYSTDNGIILINNIFQVPKGAVVGDGIYDIEESAGVSTVRFSGIGISNGHDPNDSDIPLGGLIISAGTVSGFGYQPLVAAGGTVSVSAAGTVTTVSIANSGSGYRSGVQLVSVGVRPTGGSSLVPIGTATISNGNIVGVAVTNPQVFYVPRDISDVDYTSTSGVTTVTTSTTHGLSQGDTVKLSGIAFTCNYSGSGPVNITNVVYDNTTGIMTVTTSGAHNLQTTGQRSDVLLTGIAMTCGLDGGSSTHTYPRTTDPAYCGTKVTAVNSSTEFVTNVGISTVPTFYQSGGVAQPVLIAPRGNNNSASGQDPAFHGTNTIQVIDSTSFIVNTGISTREHFYARCGKVGKPLDVEFDDPLPYFNVPAQYSSSSVTGVGKSATVNIVVGQGSSVIDFEFRYGGYAYGEGEILTVPIGGTTGIPTDTSVSFEEFQISVDRIFTDNFSGWSVGQLQVLDKFDDLFDGSTKDFRLNLNGDAISIQSSPGSKVEVDQTLIIIINDILQEPGKGYVFTGGSTVEFSEPPKIGDTSKVLFYKGNGDVDVVFTNVIETVKVGDNLNIDNLPPTQGTIFDEDIRTVTGINTLDSVETNVYQGPGITSDRNVLRPVTWCKQTVDKFINGKVVGKNRISYEPQIYPTSYLIQPVGLGSTEVYVDSLRPLFDSNNESQVRDFQDSITITSQDNIVGASGTAIVSIAGTISSISITNDGLGYTVAPTVTIGSTLGVSTIATATASISSGKVTSVTITNGGVGYTGSQVPVVLFEPPTIKKEEIGVLSYEGDFGTIVGFGNTTIGSSDNRVIFDLFIDQGSFLRNNGYVGTGITVSGISTGDFFTTFNTGIGSGTIESVTNDRSRTIGITTTFSDNVWMVRDHQTITTQVVGIGTTVVKRVFCNVSGLSTVTFSGTDLSFDSTLFTYDSQLIEVFTGGISSSFNFGKFSWGRIGLNARSIPKEFNSYNFDGYVGISTAGIVQRTNPLKFVNYIQI